MGRVAALVLAALLLGSACSRHGSGGGVGGVQARLTLSPDTIITTVHYQITGNGITPIVGDINVADPAATPSFEHSVPAGMGYLISLTAISTDGGAVCAGSATVDITAGAVSQVTVPLLCRRPNGQGDVIVNGNVIVCPHINSFSASPTTTSVGSSVDVEASATVPGNPNPLYAWTATSGTFADPTQGHTTFTCTDVGPVTLTVTVSTGQCADFAQMFVQCLPFCATRPDGTSCDDKNACTQTDSCAGGVCVGTNPVICPAQRPCHLPSTCNPANGLCSDANAPDGTSCSLPNATAACMGGNCQLQSCNTGFGNCDSMSGDGCETNLNTDVGNCGSCGRACFTGATCVGGLCISPPPTGVTATAGGWEITLGWNPSPGAVSYTVFGATSVNGPFTPVGSTTGTQFLADTVVTGVTYFYIVATSSEGGLSQPSTIVNATPIVKQFCALNTTTPSVDVFDVTQTGTATPLRRITGAATGLVSPLGQTADLLSRELFVSLGSGAIQVFPLAANGNASPVRVLTAPAGGSGYTGLAVEPYAREAMIAFTLASGAGEVVALDEGTGALKRTLTGAATTLGTATDLALDRVHQEILVASIASAAAGSVSQVLSFDSTATGAAAPKRALTTQGPARVVVYDPVNDELITTCAVAAACSKQVFVYDRTATGAPAAKRTFTVSGGNPRIQAILLDSSTDRLWLAVRDGFTMTAYQVPRTATGTVSPSGIATPITVTSAQKLSPCN
jgi:hypothetical protein